MTAQQPHAQQVSPAKHPHLPYDQPRFCLLVPAKIWQGVDSHRGQLRVALRLVGKGGAAVWR